MRNLLYTLTCLILTISAYPQKIHTTLQQNWVNEAWKDSLQDIYTYNSQGLLALKSEQRWDPASNTWVNERQDMYTYNSDSTLQQNVTQSWDAIHHVWENSMMVTDSYSTPRLAAKVLIQKWVGGNWQNSEVILYTYNKKGRYIRSSKQKWNTSAGLWVNNVRGRYTYNGKGKMDHWIAQGWDTLKHTWTKKRESRNYFLYNDSYKDIGDLSQVWINHHWLDNVRDINSYDSNGHQISVAIQVWDQAGNIWIEIGHRDFTNNKDGSVNYYVAEHWKRSTPDSEPDNKRRTSYTYL